MTSMFRRLAVAIVAVLGAGVSAGAQDSTVAKSIPLRLELVISRYQGDRKVGSAPFTFFVNATDPAAKIDDWSRVRMGVEIPVATPPSPLPPAGKPNTAPGQASPSPYRAFGTNIDCLAKILDNGQFKVSVTIDESSPYSEQERARLAASTNGPTRINAGSVFRSMRVSNVLILKDGQSQQFSTATDRFSGEVVKMDMTLTVVK